VRRGGRWHRRARKPRGRAEERERHLLVRELEDGCWTLPGGWAEVGQSATESVECARSPAIVKAAKLLAAAT
jgi:8-oxo-dGTP pyrophosphatase MutT (NUDIX family)